ncbi:MAG: GDYXXLXY domain-containing protein [Spirochaetota bacterium]
MKRIFILFIAIAIVQISIPLYLIAKREYILKTGTPYLFLTRPVDPIDIFRGRYLLIKYDFEDDLEKSLKEKYSSQPYSHKIVYLCLTQSKDKVGTIKEISEVPPQGSNYIKLKIVVSKNYTNYSLNFNQFYMDEFKATQAESIYQAQSQKKEAYALVYVKNGDVVLADLLIDNIPIRQYLKHFSTNSKQIKK